MMYEFNYKLNEYLESKILLTYFVGYSKTSQKLRIFIRFIVFNIYLYYICLLSLNQIQVKSLLII